MSCEHEWELRKRDFIIDWYVIFVCEKCDAKAWCPFTPPHEVEVVEYPLEVKA